MFFRTKYFANSRKQPASEGIATTVIAPITVCNCGTADSRSEYRTLRPIGEPFVPAFPVIGLLPLPLVFPFNCTSRLYISRSKNFSTNCFQAE